MKDYIAENYKQAVITCCWVVESGYRELLFAMLDLGFMVRICGDLGVCLRCVEGEG